MKKKFIIVLVLFVLLLTIAACTNKNGDHFQDSDTNITVGGGTTADSTDGDNGNGEGVVDKNNQGSTIPVNAQLYNTTSVYAEITITAGVRKLNAILFDNKTARAVAEMLPMTVETWHPAPDFARAFDLPESFEYFNNEPPQMSYELGSLAYWQPGPSIAMIYKASRTETVVPVVPIGKILSDVSVLADYSGSITISIK